MNMFVKQIETGHSAEDQIAFNVRKSTQYDSQSDKKMNSKNYSTIIIYRSIMMKQLTKLKS